MGKPMDLPEFNSPLYVTCPSCGAKPGHICTRPTSTGRKPVLIHLAREDLVKKD